MANIAITNYCNLKCPYCFADNFIQENKKNISIENLNIILKFLETNPNLKRIGIIGGEPTLHPEFLNILNTINNFCLQNKIRGIIFTNGIYLKDYLRKINDNIFGCLINVNSPETIGEVNWLKLEQTLKKAKILNKKNISLGINLYHDLNNYDFIFDALKIINGKTLRVSYVAPTSFNVEKNKYYLTAKDNFLRFVNQCKNNNIEIRLDCNNIPECYFNQKEKDFLLNTVFNYHCSCHPVIDITPDLKATSCFGVYNTVNISSFNNYLELEEYFQSQINLLTLKNGTGQCSTCDLFKKNTCQGGCLAFTQQNGGKKI